MDGKPEGSLERIEESLRGLHEKVGQSVEGGAVTKTEIVWLKWAGRILFAVVIGISGASLSPGL